MASNIKISTVARNAMANALGPLFNSGKIDFRTLGPPPNVSDVSSGVLLASPTFAATAFGAAATGAITANAIVSATAVASGDAGHFRQYGSGAVDTAADLQGTAGDSVDAPDFQFNNKTIVSGGTVAVTSLVITVPIQ